MEVADRYQSGQKPPRSIIADLDNIEMLLDRYYQRLETVAGKLVRSAPEPVEHVGRSRSDPQPVRPIGERVEAIGQMLEGRFDSLLRRIEAPLHITE